MESRRDGESARGVYGQGPWALFVLLGEGEAFKLTGIKLTGIKLTGLSEVGVEERRG